MKTNTKKITQGAIMIALAVVLSMFAVFKLPNGGSITVASMAPIILYSMMYDFKWSLLTSIVYACIQMIIGFYPPPAQDLLSFVLVIMLDYIIAFGVIGFAGLIAGRFKNKITGAGIATVIVLLIRLLCHFISGIVIWSSYAPEGQPVWLYSLLYNGSYMSGEIVITSIAIMLLIKYLPINNID